MKFLWLLLLMLENTFLTDLSVPPHVAYLKLMSVQHRMRVQIFFEDIREIKTVTLRNRHDFGAVLSSSDTSMYFVPFYPHLYRTIGVRVRDVPDSGSFPVFDEATSPLGTLPYFKDPASRGFEMSFYWPDYGACPIALYCNNYTNTTSDAWATEAGGSFDFSLQATLYEGRLAWSRDQTSENVTCRSSNPVLSEWIAQKSPIPPRIQRRRSSISDVVPWRLSTEDLMHPPGPQRAPRPLVEYHKHPGPLAPLDDPVYMGPLRTHRAPVEDLKHPDPLAPLEDRVSRTRRVISDDHFYPVLIRCVENCKERVAPTHPLIIQADVYIPTNNMIHYKWSATVDHKDIDFGIITLPVPPDQQHTEPRNVLRIDTARLTIGSIYTFKVAVYAPPCGCVFEASKVFITASRPKGGYIEINPMEGSSMDKFTISVLDVTDYYLDVHNLPLNYGITITNQYGATANAVVLQYGPNSTLTLPMMPPGDPSHGNIATITVTVSNIYSGTLVMRKNITVHPVQLDVNLMGMLDQFDNHKKLLLIYSTVKKRVHRMDGDAASELADSLANIPTTTVTDTSLKISALAGLQSAIPTRVEILGKYIDQLENATNLPDTLDDLDNVDVEVMRQRFTSQIIVSCMKATEDLLDVIVKKQISSEIIRNNSQIIGNNSLADLLTRSLTVLSLAGETLLFGQKGFDEPVLFDTELLLVKLQNLPPHALDSPDKAVSVVLGPNSSFTLPNVSSPDGASVNIQAYESKEQLYPWGSSNGEVNPKVLGLSITAAGIEVTRLNNSLVKYTHDVEYNPNLNYTEIGQKMSVLYNNIPLEYDTSIVYSTFSVEVKPNTVTFVIISSELIDHPLYVVVKLDEPPDDSNFYTPPGSDLGDVPGSNHHLRIWEYKFCTQTQRVVFPEVNKTEFVKEYEENLINIYPFEQWANSDGFFENYTYVDKTPIDFRTNASANIVLGEHGIAHGIILPWSDSDPDTDVPYRTFKYVSTDLNASHTLYVGLFSHIDLMPDCEHLLRGSSYGEVIFKKRYNMTVTLTSKTTGCVYWNGSSDAWEGEGCRPSNETTLNFVECECNHLSTFSSEVFEPPNAIHFSTDLLLFKDFFTNPISTIIVTFFWLIYILLIIWARRADNVDSTKTNVTVLMDNPPDGKFVYVISVLTGWLNNAGTTSIPTIYLSGSRGDSDLYALYDPCHAGFEAGSEKTFLLTTTFDLGILESLQVMTSLTGVRPTWFLHQITIFDVQTQEEYHFQCNEWMTPESPQTLQKTLHPNNHFSFKYRYSLTVSRNIRDQHLWMSIFTRPAYSTFTRKQRLTCGFTYISLSMLISLMFFGSPPDDPANQYVVYNVRISRKDVIISIQCCAIAIPINTVIVMLFKNSRQRKKKKTKTIAKEEAAASGEYDPPTWNLRNPDADGGVNARNINMNASNTEVNASNTEMSIMDEDVNANNYMATSDWNVNTAINTNYTSRTNILDYFDNEQKTYRPNRKLLKKENKVKRRSETGLPHWCIYIAWTLALSVSLVSGYFTMLYGLSYGYETSIKWAFSFFGSFLQSAGIVQPFKVLMITLLLCLCVEAPIRPMVQTDNLDIEAELKKPQVLVYPADLALLPKHIYKGPGKRRINNVLQHINYLFTLNMIFNDILFYLTFIAVFALVVFGERHPDCYLLNNTVRNIFVDASHVGSMHFNKVRNLDDIWTFLLTNFIPQSQYASGYRQDFQSVIVDMNNILVGVPRVRQVRRRKDCIDPKVNPNIPKVINQPWKRCDGQDGNDYVNSWHIKVGGRIKEMNKENLNPGRWNPWHYSTASELQTPEFVGQSSVMSGGGYVQDFSNQGNVTLKLFRRLQKRNWLDGNTMGVFIEFSVYCPAINTMSVVMLVFERTLIGDIVRHDKYVRSLKVIHVNDPNDIFMALLRFVHMILVFWYIYKLFDMAHQHADGIMSVLFFFCWRFKIETLISTSAMFTWCACVAKIWSEIKAKQAFEDSNRTGFMNWYAALYYTDAYTVMQGVCLFFMMCHTLQFPVFFRFRLILVTALTQMLNISVAAMVWMMALGISGYSRFAPESKSFKSFLRSMVSLSGFAVRELEYEGIMENQSFDWMMMIYISLICTVIWVCIFPTVQIVLISVMSQFRRRAVVHELHLADYFCARIGQLFGYDMKDETRFYREELFPNTEM